MLPVYRPGDHVLTFNWGKVSKGDVVVSRYLGMMMIKRVDKIVNDQIYVSGDNKKMSSKVPSFNLNKIIGKVILKY